MRIAWVFLVACGATPPPVVVKSAEPVAVPLTAATAIATASPITRDDLSPPFTLTASDGSGLALARVDAKAVFEGPLAFTELHLYFRNDEDRQREGTFQITLPSHAAVSRFAMENAGQFLEAEVVPKLVARRAYDDFLHRRQDPALLEKAAGNQFTAKVFPIAPRSTKHIVISYSQELAGVRYALPLRGLPKIERVDVELASPGKREQLSERDWTPDRDFVSEAKESAAAVGAGTLVAAQIEIAADIASDAPKGITLLVDTSASRSLGYERYIASIGQLVTDVRTKWGDALPLGVVAFDQDTELVFEGRAADFGGAQLKKLVERGAAGASDLGQALTWLSNRHVAPRIVLVGDGVITAGAEGKALTAIAAKLPAQRFDVFLAGGLRDDKTAAMLATALPHAGAVVDLGHTDALGDAVATNIAIEIPGATWVFPRNVAAARAGTKVMVYARMQQPSATFEVIAGGVKRVIAMQPGTAPLVERAIAGAEIEELEAKHDPKLRSLIAKKSVAARVLSTETSLLVLESDADFARYGIERKALADVIVVSANGAERMHRGAAVVVAGASTPVPTVDPRGDEPSPKANPTPKPTAGDTDADGILDDSDGCPGEPETFNGMEDGDGCPDRGRVILTDTAIEILDNVYFETNSSLIKTKSLPILDAVAASLHGNPEIALVEIQGHTDERGSDGANLDISERRANAVKDYLVRKGIDASRLVAQGYGETQPIDRGHDEASWAKNRRVAFLILRRGESAGTDFVRAPKPPPKPEPVVGELAEIEREIRGNKLDDALAKARDWHAREPGDVLALIGLGEVLEAKHVDATAARVYGSIIDLYPGRADMRRFAGERLARLPKASDLAIDTYRRAVADRPDHMTGHRLLAYALVRANKPADAFTAILAGVDQTYRDDSYRGGMRVLGEDAAMIGAVYATAVPSKRAEIVKALATRKLALATEASTRFVLYWETDGNDVDFHIRDAQGAHAFYSNKALPSGGELYDDVTTGYGPECFAIHGAPQAAPYSLSVDYYAQGPMGYGMGLLEIQTFDPKRGLRFEDRPYIIMNSHAMVELGSYRPQG